MNLTFLTSSLIVAALVLNPTVLFGEGSLPTIHTYADLEAEIVRNAERHNEGLLIGGKQDFDDTEFISSLFYDLPLSERAVYVIASFAATDLDGEKAEIMYLFLTRRHYPHIQRDPVPERTVADRAYTRAIFKQIHSFSTDNLKAFCGRVGDYRRFRKNLQQWEMKCAADE